MPRGPVSFRRMTPPPIRIDSRRLARRLVLAPADAAARSVTAPGSSRPTCLPWRAIQRPRSVTLDSWARFVADIVVHAGRTGGARRPQPRRHRHQPGRGAGARAAFAISSISRPTCCPPANRWPTEARRTQIPSCRKHDSRGQRHHLHACANRRARRVLRMCSRRRLRICAGAALARAAQAAGDAAD